MEHAVWILEKQRAELSPAGSSVGIHFCQIGPMSQRFHSFPQSSPCWGPNVQICKPVEDISDSTNNAGLYPPLSTVAIGFG